MVFNSNMRKTGVLVVVICAALLITGCSSGRVAESGPIRVVAAENFWGNVAAQIGGSHVQVTSIISGPDTDPHEYESSTRNAAEIARAGLVIQNGLGYDDFIGKLLSASSSSSSDKLLRIDEVMSVSGDNPNPHLWYDTAKLPLVASAIAAALGHLDPAHAATFTANAAAFTASLAPLTALIADIKAHYAGIAIAYTERVPGYLVDAAGLRLGVPASFAQSVEDGNDPSASDTAAFDDALRGHRVKALLYNSQVADSTTDKIKSQAVQSGVPVVGVSETIPASDKDFQSWQLRQARELLTALGG